MPPPERDYQYIVVETRNFHFFAIRIQGVLDLDFERCLPKIKGHSYIWTRAETAEQAVREAKIERLRAAIEAACIN